MSSLSAMAPVFVPSTVIATDFSQSETRGELDRVMKRNEYLEGKKNRLREKLVDADKAVQDLREKVKSLEEEKTKSNEEMAKKCEILEEKNMRDGMRFNQMKRNYEDRLRSSINMNDTLVHEVKIMSEKISKQERTIEELEQRGYDEKWVGYALRLNWIIQEGAKVGAIRLPDHEWMTDMAHDIEFPESGSETSTSIYWEVPSHIRRKYLPNYDDAHMEFTDEDQENQLLDRLSEEASEFSNGIPEPLNHLLEDDPEDALNKIRLIQSSVRKYISRKEPSGVEVYAAVTIQRIFRGFLSRGVRYYKPMIGFLKTVGFEEGRYNTPGLRRERPNRVSITFFNTGSDLYAYDWINKNGRVQGRQTIIRSFTSAGVKCSTFASHWFEVTNETRGWKKLVRIPMSITMVDGRLYPQNYYFDVHTGITVSNQQFNCIVPHFNVCRREGTGVPVTIRGRNIIMGYNLIDRDDEDESFQNRIQIAIQLSLEENVDDDYGDFLFDMFN